MNRVLVLSFLMVFLVSLSLSDSASAARMERVKPIEVAADAPDSSVELVGFLFVPPERLLKGKPPVVILLHGIGDSHSVWKLFWEDLLSLGYAVFAIDLRGHGLSIFDLRQGRNRSPGTFVQNEHLNFPADVKFLVDTMLVLHGALVDTAQLAVVGASIGANTALLYAHSEPRVKYTALISPGLDYRGLRIAPVMREFGDRPLFIAAGDKDIYSNESINLLSDVVPRILDVEIYDSIFHGTRLLNTTLPLKQRIFEDLSRYFSN